MARRCASRRVRSTSRLQSVARSAWRASCLSIRAVASVARSRCGVGNRVSTAYVSAREWAEITQFLFAALATLHLDARPDRDARATNSPPRPGRSYRKDSGSLSGLLLPGPRRVAGRLVSSTSAARMTGWFRLGHRDHERAAALQGDRQRDGLDLHAAALYTKLDLRAGAQIGGFAYRLRHNDTAGTINGRGACQS